MKRLCLVLVGFLFLSLLLTFTAIAHSGRTDGNGGHYDKSTGEYHYHHGYPAHKHIGGECPYNFHDDTNHSSSSNSSNRAEKSVSATEWVGIVFSTLLIIFLFLAIGLGACPILHMILAPVLHFIEKKFNLTTSDRLWKFLFVVAAIVYVAFAIYISLTITLEDHGII